MRIKSSEDVKALFSINVIVSALGYFVDMYDLLLFGIVRVPSLKSIGVEGDALVTTGVYLLNMQMTGMLLGGIIWGILGDKKGRVSVLFGSIFLYSVANIANAFVKTPDMYAIMRFLAGVGLAGELGAAVTLVSETLPQRLRGYGTAIVASVGILGSVTAALVGDFLNWTTAYIVGGCLGFLLLLLRIRMFESGMYSSIKSMNVRKGDFLSLFTSRRRLFRYLQCILIGLPTWFVVGVLITFSPEFGRKLGLTGPISAGSAIMFTYLGLVVGDIASGFGSQIIKSRKKVVYTFLSMTTLLVAVYLYSYGASPAYFYTLCLLIGISIGYWAVFVTIASEQFGTNLRATVTTTVPNFVRGATVPITLSFTALKGHLDIIHSAMIVGAASLLIAFISLYYMEESYHKDLNYLEEYL
ncbi:MAG: MFS transporter [Ignavibacteria bacterium]|jgi:MFS family permease|nr:MFS transporter [Ignavibacteria bacterium]MCU7504509.1 MFS transporter [Ignavibacteria bacterium]MCU7517830.1 MFS transporter [Ignavibacteria bacterium]